MIRVLIETFQGTLNFFITPDMTADDVSCKLTEAVDLFPGAYIKETFVLA